MICLVSLLFLPSGPIVEFELVDLESMMESMILTQVTIVWSAWDKEAEQKRKAGIAAMAADKATAAAGEAVEAGK